MKLRYYSALTALACSAMLQAASVVTKGDGTLSYFENAPEGCVIQIDFAKCMANELFTFSNVWLNGKNINQTGSDNIGPFGIAGLGWSGGNHLNNDIRSARTDSIRILLDGEPVDLASPGMRDGTKMTVEVFNTLLMPSDTSAVFAKEHYIYNVSGNSIEVEGAHDFLNEKPVIIDRYYGMQSMCIGETELLTPGGEYSQWTPVAEVSSFTKASAPKFCLFVEHTPVGYQAAWLDTTKGIGDRHLVDKDDVAFIGNSWTKSYHKTIGSKPIKKGDRTNWRGIYSWFDKPLSDNARGGDGSFAYEGYVDGRRATFSAAASGDVTIKTTDKNEYPARKLKVMSYNLRFGERAPMDRLAAEIKVENPDFVALQEVDVNAARRAAGENMGLNYINELAQRTGMFGYYGRTINFLGGYYGVAILSKHPATDVRTYPLPNPKNAEARVLLKGKFLLDGVRPFVFASTHLDYSDRSTTLLQAQHLLPILTSDGIPAIVGGDFNTSTKDDAIIFMASEGATLSGTAPTFPSDGPTTKIDHLFGYPEESFILEESHEGPVSDHAASDHLPIISTVTLR